MWLYSSFAHEVGTLCICCFRLKQKFTFFVPSILRFLFEQPTRITKVWIGLLSKGKDWNCGGRRSEERFFHSCWEPVNILVILVRLVKARCERQKSSRKRKTEGELFMDINRRRVEEQRRRRGHPTHNVDDDAPKLLYLLVSTELARRKESSFLYYVCKYLVRLLEKLCSSYDGWAFSEHSTPNCFTNNQLFQSAY